MKNTQCGRLHPTAVRSASAIFATGLRGVAAPIPPVPLLTMVADDAGRPVQLIASLKSKKPFAGSFPCDGTSGCPAKAPCKGFNLSCAVTLDLISITWLSKNTVLFIQ
jgi:hypothetical protein